MGWRVSETLHIYEKWYTDKTSNKRTERKWIVETAAAVVRKDVKPYIFDGETYPAASSWNK